MSIKILTIPVGFLETNCYVIYDETSRDALIVDPGDDADIILDKIHEEKLNIQAIINTHAHFDHIGANAAVTEATGADIYRPNSDGEEKSFGTLQAKFYTTPGHTADGISFIIEDHLFSGDTLFRESVGRTDLGGGDFGQLIDSIKTKLFALPGNVTVHPGHGPATTIEYEKKNNPFLKQ